MTTKSIELGKNKLVSVVIPCRNEVKHIEACVRSLLASDYPYLEIFVVDGMSDDGTREVLQKLAEEYGNVFMIDNVNQLTPYAFNLGIKNSTGEYVQIVGSRNTLNPDYLSKLVQVLETQPEVACVGGDCRHIFETPAGKWISHAMESWFGVGGSNFRVQKEDAFVDTVGIPMFRRSIFNEVGYFDEDLTRNQDDDFSYRLTQSGRKIFYRHEAKVLYLVRGSLKKAFQQYFQYGYFKVFVNKKHRAVTTLRQLVPGLFVLFLALGLVGSLLEPSLLAPYCFILGLYLIIGFIAAGEFTKKFGEKLKIQRAILVLHVGYGLGYLRGCIDFLLLNKKPSAQLQKLTT